VTAVEDSRKRSTSKFAGLTLEEGDRIHLTTGGGGGWGDPRQRDRTRVEEDVAEGWISPEAARTVYAA
jgi:N-methylhydantoinase B